MGLELDVLFEELKGDELVEYKEVDGGESGWLDVDDGGGSS